MVLACMDRARIHAVGILGTGNGSAAVYALRPGVEVGGNRRHVRTILHPLILRMVHGSHGVACV